MRAQTMLLVLLVASAPALAQTPEALLATLSPESQAWVHQSCPKILGPSLWNDCIRREVRALSHGVPDLSKLSTEERNWILSSCPRTLGPSLAIPCLNRELDALAAGIPSLSNLSPEKQAWVRQACSKLLPPSLYRSCLSREASAAAGMEGVPHLAPAPPPVIAGSPLPAGGRVPRLNWRAGSYEIEVSHNDEFFIINGEKFEAKTYCFDMEEGDPVIFLEGSPYGVCTSAVILNLRTREKCAVWCE